MKTILFVLMLIAGVAFAQVNGEGFFGAGINAGTTVQQAEVSVANEVRILCWELEKEYTVNTVVGSTYNAGSASCLWGLGIYDADGSIVVKNDDALPCDAAYSGGIDDEFTETVIPAGWYCQGFTANETTANVFRGFTVNYIKLINYDAIVFGKCANSSVNGILPDTCDNPTALSTGQFAAAWFSFVEE